VSEMIERVANALAQDFAARIAEMASTPERQMVFGETGVTMPDMEVWRRYARAAVEAMREPVGGMIGAGGVAQFKADMALTPVRSATIAVYQAMIEEALK